MLNPTQRQRFSLQSLAIRMPRRTVRLRLTLLFGGLILACGAALLTVTYLLVSHSAVTFQRPDGRSISIVGGGGRASATGGTYIVHSERALVTPGGSASGPASEHPASEHPATEGSTSEGVGDPPPQLSGSDLTPAQLQDQATLLEELALRQRAAQLHSFLAQSGIALAVLAVLALALGWIVSGRLLRRLRTITMAAQQISATNLHQRLAFDGPDDELKELGDTFDALLGRLEASFAAQRQFVANASHELRTPLARQRALGQVALADPGATTQTLRTAHERVLVAGAQQERLIEALLTLARGQAGLETREPFDLAKLAAETLAIRAGEAGRRGISVQAELSPALAAGNPRLAERLVANLVDNALRHNLPDGELSVVTAVRHGQPVITVTNTGPVIAEDATGDLFKPFTRPGQERTAANDGLGLGLSIVQAIADAHEATIEAQPRAGGGLRMSVTFQAFQTGT